MRFKVLMSKKVSMHMVVECSAAGEAATIADAAWTPVIDPDLVDPEVEAVVSYVSGQFDYIPEVTVVEK